MLPNGTNLFNVDAPTCTSLGIQWQPNYSLTGECSQNCPPQCQSQFGGNSFCFDTDISTCLNRNGTVVNDNLNQTFCIFEDSTSVSSCNSIGGSFVDCSLVVPDVCFACQKVGIWHCQLTLFKGFPGCPMTGASLCHLNFDIPCQTRQECETIAGSCSDEHFLVDLSGSRDTTLFKY